MTCPHPHVVVTGASSGIGRAAVLRLADAGWHVYAGVRRSDDGKALIRASKSGNITPLIMDVTEPDQISAGAETVDQHVGAKGLTALVDNARDRRGGANGTGRDGGPTVAVRGQRVRPGRGHTGVSAAAQARQGSPGRDRFDR